MCLFISMKNSMNTNINFSANFIKQTTIAKYNKGRFIDVDASVVELIPNDKKDVKALKSATHSWLYGDEFGFCILDDIEDIRDKKKDGNIYKAYAITTQKENYSQLEGKKILGAGILKKSGDNELKLRFLQVAPDMSFNNRSRRYKNIGRALIDFFKSQSEGKTLLVQAFYSAANFYEKMGFEMINTKSLIYKWVNSIKK